MSIDVNVQNDLVIVTESSEDIVVNVSNAQGPAGAAGANGVGVPVGGATGQVLKKLSATNYDTYWALDGGGVPYSGATGDVNLGTHRIIAQNATIASNGSGDTALINHTSGSGIGLNITKGGNGEGLYVNKTGGSGNAATIIGTLNATSLVKSGGTSSQFLKADGSVDSSVYITGITSGNVTTALGFTPVPTTRTITINGTTLDLSADRSYTVSGSGDTIYTANGTLAGDRIVTSNGNSLTILGGKEEISGFPTEQISLRLQGSTTAKNPYISLKNTNANGKDYALRSMVDGTFDIFNITNLGFVFRHDYTNNLTLFRASSILTDLGFSLGSSASVVGLWLNGTRTIGNYAICHSGGDTFLNAPTGGKIGFRAGNADKMTLTNAGRLLLGTTTEGTDLLLVNGSARANTNLYIGNATGNYAGLNSLFIGGSVSGAVLDFVVSSARSAELFANSSEFQIFTSSTPINFVAFNTLNPILNLQGFSAQIGTTTAVSSSILTIQSTTRGFLPPRMTTAQRDAIASPATGLSVYNTTTNENNTYNGTAWVAAGGGGSNIYTADGTLASARTITSNGNILTILGGGLESGLGQIGLRLQGSATTSDIWLSLKNTNASGKDYIIRSLTTGVLSIDQWNSTAPGSTNIYNATNLYTQFQANSVRYLFASETNGIPGLWINVAAGSQTLANSALLKNGNDTILSSNSLVRFYNGSNDTGRIFASTGNWLIQTGGTFVDNGFRLDVNGTARVSGKAEVEASVAAAAALTDNVLRITNTNTSNKTVGFPVLYLRRSGASGISFENSATFDLKAYQSNTSNSYTQLDIRVSEGFTFTPDVTIMSLRGIGVGINNASPHASAMLDVASTTKGFLPPRLTTTQKNAIGTPAAGLQVYDTTLNQMSYYNGTNWINF